jgi:Protein of unknown function (DUF3105)
MTHVDPFAELVARRAAARARSLSPTLGLVLVVTVLAACGSADDEGLEVPAGGSAGSSGVGGSGAGAAGANSSGGSGGNAGSAGSSPGGSGGTGNGACNVLTVDSPPTSAAHIAQCSEVIYATNPPSGGQHYGDWAAFQTYDFPLAAGNLVHNLEHGGVVFWYNCPEGCAEEVADVQALIDGLPADPLCQGTGVERRAILVPYPELATRWGVSAWGSALTADCVDEEAFITFYVQHFGRGPEQLCIAGEAFTADPCP